MYALVESVVYGENSITFSLTVIKRKSTRAWTAQCTLHTLLQQGENKEQKRRERKNVLEKNVQPLLERKTVVHDRGWLSCKNHTQGRFKCVLKCPCAHRGMHTCALA